ncbi:MAG: acyltransferase family protein [Alphaproteobacteria bacterium]|nr:acyltransferase family protein [Alphaproteobacteria bacterium]
MGTESTIAPPQRLYHLDALRVLAMAGVFVFHCGRAFDSEGWHVKSLVRAEYFDLQTALLSQWLMPLFFLISGWVTYTALARTSAGTFAWSRLTRLGVPFVLGTLILVPPQVYIERVTQSGVTRNFFEWFPSYFDGLYAFGGNFAWMGLHLWYLEMLLVFSFLLLPVFLIFRRQMRTGPVPGWALVALAGAVIVAVELFVSQDPDGIGMRDFGGWSPLTYLVLFLVGHTIGRSPAFQHGFVATRWITAAIGAAGVLMLVAYVTGMFSGVDRTTEALVRVAIAWGGIAAMFGFAAKHLTARNAVIAFANRYVLQFYVLHQTVIVILGFWLLGWTVDPHAKFLVTLVASFTIIAVSLAVYNVAKAKALGMFKPARAF